MQFGLEQRQIEAINAVFAKHPAINKVILYGSRAKGSYTVASDIDFAIIDDSLRFPEFLQIENELDDLLLPYKIDLSQKKNIEMKSLLEHIERVGKVFYRRAKQ